MRCTKRFDDEVIQNTRPGGRTRTDTGGSCRNFHPVFAQFIDNVKNEAEDAPKNLLALTIEFFHKSSTTYENETCRRDALFLLLQQGS
jgi:hypothetical protein